MARKQKPKAIDPAVNATVPLPPPPELPPELKALLNRKPPPRQVLKTPLYEAGVHLDPITPVSLKVLTGIRRAWSVLWGHDGSLLRMLRCSDSGILAMSDLSAEKFDTISRTGTLAGAAWSVQDFGVLHDRFRMVCNTAVLSIEFSANNVNWFGRSFKTINQPFPQYYARARYVRVRDWLLLDVPDYEIVGDRLL